MGIDHRKAIMEKLTNIMEFNSTKERDGEFYGHDYIIFHGPQVYELEHFIKILGLTEAEATYLVNKLKAQKNDRI